MRACNHTLVLFLLLIGLTTSRQAYAQDTTSLDKALSLPDKLFSFINKKTSAIENRLDRQTEKYLHKLQQQENRLKRKLLKKDSALAKQLFAEAEGKYQSLQSLPQQAGKYSDVYSPHLDSLSTALNFLGNNSPSVNHNGQVQHLLKDLHHLQGKLNQTEQIQKYIAQRKQQLKEQLQHLGMVKELKKYQKQVYYYQAQVQEIRNLWEEPDKLETKLLEVAMKLPRFKDFFARNSQLGSLFALPSSAGGATASVQGLQTRAMLNDQLQQRFGSGANVTQMLQQNVQAAQNQLSELKNKVSQYTEGSFGNSPLGSGSPLGDGGGGGGDMPDFKPRATKTQSFWKRIEYGGNIQSQKARSFFPTTSDIAATIGYKLNDKSVAGLGVSGKLGWGKGWDNIKLTYQGISIRSFCDWKLKGSIFFSGGYEMNYMSLIKSMDQFKDHSVWQQSGLVGVSKKYNISKKLKGNVQLLWDFLSYQQVPRAQPVLFRVGYGLK